jgi:glycosyltransferase involved in cell wall biosynthesis
MKYFCSAIDSISDAVQLFPHPTELLIILNNISEEHKSLILKDLENYPFQKRVINCKSNDFSEVLNFGIQESSYEIIARMDADDIVTPRRFIEQFSLLVLHPKIAVLGGQTILIDENDGIIGRTRYPTSPNIIKKELQYRNCLAHPTVLFRKSVVISSGGYRSDFAFAEDYDLWVRLSDNWEIANMDVVVLKYRIHSSQVSSYFFLTQLKSTVRIMGRQFNVDSYELERDLETISTKDIEIDLSSILTISSFSRNSSFKCAVAIMILRRGSRYTGFSASQNFHLLLTAFRSNPFLSVRVLIPLFLSRLLTYSKKTL